MALTKAQAEALKWLTERNGDGCFDKHGVLLAAGETAPVSRSTWNALRDAGLIEFYNPVGKGRGRARLRAPEIQAARTRPVLSVSPETCNPAPDSAASTGRQQRDTLGVTAGETAPSSDIGGG